MIPASAHYRPATSKRRRCLTCKFDSLFVVCTMYRDLVHPNGVCDQWEKNGSKDKQTSP